VFGVWAVGALVSLAPSSAPRVDEVGLDATVFAFAALLTLATGVAFGLVPALQSSRTDVSHALNDAARGGSGMAGRAIRRTLVVAEIALALMLLTGGALLLETFVRLQSADLGFNPENVLVGFVNPPRTSYDTAAKRHTL
jgi:putative ABC transport system permease protein